jgi:hypothetical protein
MHLAHLKVLGGRLGAVAQGLALIDANAEPADIAAALARLHAKAATVIGDVKAIAESLERGPVVVPIEEPKAEVPTAADAAPAAPAPVRATTRRTTR